MPSRLIWLAVRIAAVIAMVVVPFGYAVTGVQTDVLMGAGCGLAVGVGVGLRGGLFAAVMSSIGPKLDRIARHLADDGRD